MNASQATPGSVAFQLILSFVILSLTAPHAGAQVGASTTDEPRLHIRDTGIDSIAGIALKTRFPDDTPISRPLEFDLELISATDLGEIEAILEITDGEAQIAEVVLRTSATAGITPMRLGWQPQELPDGHYPGTIRIGPLYAKPLVTQSFVITKRSRLAVESTLERARDAIVGLKKSAEAGAPSPIFAARLAIAEDALLKAAQLHDDWFRSYDIAERVLQTTGQLRAGITLARHIPERSTAIAHPNLARLEIAHAGFTAEGRPVFLAGLAAQADSEWIDRIARYGLNFAALHVSAPLDSAARAGLTREVGESARDRNLALAYLLASDGVSSSEFAAAAGDLARGQELVTLAIVTHPTVDTTSPRLREQFIARVKETYADRFELNRIWRQRLLGFHEIEIKPDLVRHSYQYDWQIFRQDRLDAEVLSLTDSVRAAAPAAPLSIALDGDLLEPGSTRQGLYHERVVAYFDRGVLTTSSAFKDPVFGTRYPAQVMLYALRRAFAPEAPLIVVHKLDFANPANWYGRQTSRDVETFVWEAAMEGVAAVALDLSGAAERADLPASLQFDVLDGLVEATHDVNRLAEIVEAFRTKKPSVAILWSDSSRILNDGVEHLASLRRAYEGASFGGYKLRFLTERQLEGHELDGIKLLIVPDTPSLSRAAHRALREIVDNGLPMIRSSSPIPYDSRGRSHQDVVSYGLNALLVRGNDASTEYMEAMDESISSGRLPELPRVINPWGYPIEGVKTRHVTFEGVDYLYLINLRKDPVVCHLSAGHTAGRDLIRGQDLLFPRSIESLRPMLIRLAADDSEAAQGAP